MNNIANSSDTEKKSLNAAVICFSKQGAALAGKLIDGLTKQASLNDNSQQLAGHEGIQSEAVCFTVRGYITQRHADGTPLTPFTSVYELTAQLFDEVNALIFVSACGIAVRAVAPLIKSKLTDPAVIVCDEAGRFAVSLLSGHAGGANQLAEQIAAVTGAVPVITTASDSNAAIDGKPQPRNLVLGIGCRRGLTAEHIERTVTVMLWDEKIPLARVCGAATIDVKRDEAGLLRFTEAHGIPLTFYPAEELAALPGEFTPSEMVLKTVGVDNVCERAAALKGGNGRLILKKTARNGVTVAVFEKD
jgi:cobalt-precorrin 5A hydrolase